MNYFQDVSEEKKKKPTAVTKRSVFSSFINTWCLVLGCPCPAGCCRCQTQPVPDGCSGPSAGQCWSPQPGWRRLWESIFQEGQKHCAAVESDSTEERSVKSKPAHSRVGAEGGEVLLQAEKQKFLGSPWKRPWSSQYPHCSPGRTPDRSRSKVAVKELLPMENLGRSKLMAGTAAGGRDLGWSSL